VQPAAGQVQLSALGGLLRTAAKLDRTQSDPVIALRNTIGVTLPLAYGLARGDAALGLAAAIGALQTSFADRPGPYRLRMLRMSGTALATMVTTLLAILLAGSNLASAALLAGFGFIAGLLLTAGPSAAQLGVAATACALVLGHTHQPFAAALHTALIVLVGGLIQTVLAIAAWPLGRHRPERAALAGLYRDLAQLATQPADVSAGPPLVDALVEVRQTLYGLGHDHGPSVESYRVLLDDSERIRREVLVVGGYASRLEREGASDAAGIVRAALRDVAAALDSVAGALERARPVRRAQATGADLVGCAAALADDPHPTGRAAAVRIANLAALVRSVLRTAATGATEGRQGTEPGDAYGLRALRDPVAVLRANLTPDSAVMRHAVRLGVLVGGSDLVVRQAGVARGYWVPLTILVVLRPDFSTTFQRGIARVVGTILGLGLATALLHVIPGVQWYAVALIALFFFGMRLAGPGNVALGAVCLSALVVILLSLAGVSAHATVAQRAADTVVGGALALVATLVWPVWERERVADQLVVLLRAYRDYALAVADLSFDLPRMQAARAASRLARSNAQASVDRARAEPVHAQFQIDLADSVLANTHRFIHAVMAIDGLRPALREAGGNAELTEVLTAAAQYLDQCAVALGDGGPPKAPTAVTSAQAELAPRAEDSVTDAAVTDAAERISESLQTLGDQLRRQLGKQGSLAGRA
jgi:uncharacterized membrane protein YccC